MAKSSTILTKIRQLAQSQELIMTYEQCQHDQ